MVDARDDDVGAGAGSIGIEWMRVHPSCRAVAVESDPVRAQRIGRNAERLGVPGLQVVEGKAPDSLVGLPQPDAADTAVMRQELLDLGVTAIIVVPQPGADYAPVEEFTARVAEDPGQSIGGVQLYRLTDS